MSAPVLKLWCYPEPIEMAMRGMDKLHSALRYLDQSLKSNPLWAYETTRAEMQANMDARCLLLKLQAQLYCESQRLAKAEGWL